MIAEEDLGCSHFVDTPAEAFAVLREARPRRARAATGRAIAFARSRTCADAPTGCADDAPRESERALLLRVARQAMVEHGLEPDFPPAALAEAGALCRAARGAAAATRAICATLPWCSIDNDDSRDLDQLTVAEALAGGRTTIRVAVADVSAAVAPGSALDEHAPHQHDLGLHAAAELPDAARAAEHRPHVAQPGRGPAGRGGRDRRSDADGACGGVERLPRARAQPGQARLPRRGAWLEGEGPLPPAAAAVPGLAREPAAPGRGWPSG